MQSCDDFDTNWVSGFESTRVPSFGLDLEASDQDQHQDQDLMQWQGYGKYTRAFTNLISYRLSTGSRLQFTHIEG